MLLHVSTAFSVILPVERCIAKLFGLCVHKSKCVMDTFGEEQCYCQPGSVGTFCEISKIPSYLNYSLYQH